MCQHNTIAYYLSLPYIKDLYIEPTPEYTDDLRYEVCIPELGRWCSCAMGSSISSTLELLKEVMTVQFSRNIKNDITIPLPVLMFASECKFCKVHKSPSLVETFDTLLTNISSVSHTTQLMWDGFYIECPNCKQRTKIFQTREEAISNWLQLN